MNTSAETGASAFQTITAAPPVVIPVGKPSLLTVGPGQEFATLGDALRAADAGDTIAVQAGTYTNDFGTVTQAVSIVAVGGLVHEVATEPPPDDKGLLTVDANLSITGFTFTGGSDGSPDGNVAGIRQEAGNLSVNYCEFSGMQEGMLVDPNPAGTITIDNSYFHDNGTGDGYSHDLYIGAVNTALIENSVFTTANVGHEIKSRAANTTIINNVIADGPTGTASYDIDIPNGGVAVVSGNVIEKGPNASNYIAIHYGGETQYSWAQNSLTVSGNAILNDIPAGKPSIAVYNQSAANGLSVSAQISGNQFWNYEPGNIALGAADITGNTALSSEPGYSTQSPLGGLPQILLGAGPEVLHLDTGNHTVSGSARLLIVCDTAGSNTVRGGAGGLQISANAGWDQIATASGASDVINLPGRNSVVMSYGNDFINATANYSQIDAFGHATINSTAFDSFALNGAGETLGSSGGGNVDVGASGRATVVDTAGDLVLSTAAGAVTYVVDKAGAAQGAANTVATVSGAASGVIANAGTLALTTGGTGAAVTVAGGGASITGGAGNDSLVVAGGNVVFAMGDGTDSVLFTGGNASVTAGSGADAFTVQAGDTGTIAIAGFQPGTDTLNFENYSGAAVVSGSVVNGSTWLALAGGATVEVLGVALPGYPVQVTGGGGGGGGPITGSGTLTTGGHTVIGGAARLSVVDDAGNNTISGGSGGLVLQSAGSDVISTAAGAADTVSLYCHDTLSGAGADQVTVSGYCNVLHEQGAATVSLLGAANIVQSGLGPMFLSDSVGGDSITGGLGGMMAALAGTYDAVTTAAGASDTVALGGSSALLSQGNDRISLSAVADTVIATGAATITATASWAAYVLDGREQVSASGGFAATVGGGTASLASTGQGGQATVAAGAVLALSQALGSGGDATVTVAGGQSIVNATGGVWAQVAVAAGAGASVSAGLGPVMVASSGAHGQAGVLFSAGSGNVTLNGGAANDVFHGGSGQAVLNLGSGTDTVTFGNGAATINAGGTDYFVVEPGCGGTAVITGWSGADAFVAPGGGGVAPSGETVTGGSTWLNFSGGLQVELVGVSHFA